jgi:hypothetical protein
MLADQDMTMHTCNCAIQMSGTDAAALFSSTCTACVKFPVLDPSTVATRAATPDVIGVAMLVPVKKPYWLPLAAGRVDRMSLPGAARST